MTEKFWYLFGLLFGAGVVAKIGSNHIKNIHLAHELELRKQADAVWHEAFQKGWSSSQSHYSRYYTEEQYQFVFGRSRTD